MKMAALALSFLCATACIAAGKSDSAAGFPAKPIRWVVPFAPGASTDLIARTVAARLTEIWGKQIIIDNRGGAGGAIGGEIVARAAPDGYTVMLATSGPNIGKVNWASAGINSTPHISLALFMAATGVKLIHVPYKSGAPAMVDVVSGQVAGILTSVA